MVAGGDSFVFVVIVVVIVVVVVVVLVIDSSSWSSLLSPSLSSTTLWLYRSRHDRRPPRPRPECRRHRRHGATESFGMNL